MGEPAPQQGFPRLTVAEFLDWNDGTDTRYELVNGTIIAMTPPLEAHATMVVNLAAEIRSRLKPPCRVLSEAGIRLPNHEDRYYQADLVVACQPPVVGAHFPTAPKVIIEILSPSTASHDRGTKLPDYRSLPSVQEIVILSSTTIQAEIWQRSGAGWSVMDLVGEDARLSLPSLNINLPLSVVYENVALEEMTAEEAKDEPGPHGP